MSAAAAIRAREDAKRPKPEPKPTKRRAPTVVAVDPTPTYLEEVTVEPDETPTADE